MENQNEDEEVVEELEDEIVEENEEVQEDTTDWKAKFEETEGRLRRAEKKLSKAKSSVEKKASQPSESDGLDYGKKAFLNSNGIKGAKEFDFVENELAKSGEELEDLLENDYFKSKLEKFRAINRTSEAIPKSSNGGGTTTNSVEYWMTKPIEEVPADMRRQVVNAKIAKDKTKGKFYNS
jgi:hypothetical protein